MIVVQATAHWEGRPVEQFHGLSILADEEGAAWWFVAKGHVRPSRAARAALLAYRSELGRSEAEDFYWGVRIPGGGRTGRLLKELVQHVYATEVIKDGQDRWWSFHTEWCPGAEAVTLLNLVDDGPITSPRP